MPRMLTFRHTGDWGPREVVAEWVEPTRPVFPEVETLIERAWSDTLSSRPGVQLFDGPMCRLERAAVENHALRLALSRTSYKVFLGTNLTHPGLADRYGPEVLANPVGVSPALETADGFLLLGRRSSTVAYYPDRVHPFAGALEPRDAGDVFAAVRRELKEELSLQDGDVTDLRCAGLVQDASLRQPELIFRARCALNRQQVEETLDRVEHRGTWSVEAAPDALARAIRDPALTPVAIASLLLWGRARWGDAWYRSAMTA